MDKSNTKSQQELALAAEELAAYMKACKDGSESFSAFHPTLNAVEDAIRLTKFQNKPQPVDAISLDLKLVQVA